MERIVIPTSIMNVPIVEKALHNVNTNTNVAAYHTAEAALVHEENKHKDVQETESSENKTINPDERNSHEKKKKNKDDNKHQNRGPDSGKFIDYSA